MPVSLRESLEVEHRPLRKLAAVAPPREVLGSITFWTDAETSDGVRYQFLEKR